MSIIVRRYGLLPPTDWGDDCQEQLFLANKLWNSLVQIERETTAKWHQVFARDPEYAELEVRHDAVQQDIGDALKARRQVKRKDHSGQDDANSALAKRIPELVNQRKNLLTEMKARRGQLKESFKNDLDVLEAERWERVKEARQHSGLFWCNYNAVIHSYNTARPRVMKTGGQLQFHAFDGSGRFVNQIQGGVGVEDIFAGRCSQVSIAPLPEDAFTACSRQERRRKQRATLTFTAYTREDENGKRWRRNLTFPMVMHRPIPGDARVKNVEVRRRKVGSEFEWSVVFFCASEREPPTVTDHPSDLACGINFGWRVDQHGLRVATLVDRNGRQEYLHLPNSAIDRLTYCEQLQSELDESANAVREKISGWLSRAREEKSIPDTWLERATAAVRSRTARKIVRLALSWRESAETWHREWFVEIEGWRKEDKRKRQEMENLRQKAIGCRRDAYKVWTHGVANRYSVIGIGQLSLKKAAALVKNEDALPPLVRKNRSRAAISELLEWLHSQAAKSGSMIVEAKRPVTQTCYLCRKKHPVKREVVMQVCPNCGAVWDQDINAAFVAMDDALSSPFEP